MLRTLTLLFFLFQLTLTAQKATTADHVRMRYNELKESHYINGWPDDRLRDSMRERNVRKIITTITEPDAPVIQTKEFYDQSGMLRKRIHYADYKKTAIEKQHFRKSERMQVLAMSNKDMILSADTTYFNASGQREKIIHHVFYPQNERTFSSFGYNEQQKISTILITEKPGDTLRKFIRYTGYDVESIIVVHYTSQTDTVFRFLIQYDRAKITEVRQYARHSKDPVFHARYEYDDAGQLTRSWSKDFSGERDSVFVIHSDGKKARVEISSPGKPLQKIFYHYNRNGFDEITTLDTSASVFPNLKMRKVVYNDSWRFWRSPNVRDKPFSELIAYGNKDSMVVESYTTFDYNGQTGWRTGTVIRHPNRTYGTLFIFREISSFTNDLMMEDYYCVHDEKNNQIYLRKRKIRFHILSLKNIF